MATNFPQNLDDFTNPTPTTPVQGVHAQLHSDVNDAIEAIEEKIGVDGSTDESSFDYKLSDVADGDKAVSQTGSETLENKTLEEPTIIDPIITGVISDENVNEALELPATADAVNYFSLQNSATGQAIKLEAKGDDTNIDINITPKGNGRVKVGSSKLPLGTGNPGQILSTLGNEETQWVDGISPDAAILKASSYLLAETQEVPDLTLKVRAGSFVYNNAPYVFAGGNSPTFTAPVSNPRIDILGLSMFDVENPTLEIISGEEGTTPVEPTIGINFIPVCVVYNRPGQSSILNLDDSVNGYISKDARLFFEKEEQTNSGKFINQTIMDLEINPSTYGENYLALSTSMEFDSNNIAMTSGGNSRSCTIDYEYFWTTYMSSDDPQVNLYQRTNGTTLNPLGNIELSTSNKTGTLVPISSTQALYFSFDRTDSSASSVFVDLVTWNGSTLTHNSFINGAGSGYPTIRNQIKRTTNPNEFILFSHISTSGNIPELMTTFTYNPAGPSGSFSTPVSVPYPSGLDYNTGWSSFAYLGDGYFAGQRNNSGDVPTRNLLLIWKSDGSLVNIDYSALAEEFKTNQNFNSNSFFISNLFSAEHIYFHLLEKSSPYQTLVCYFDTSLETFVLVNRLVADNGVPNKVIPLGQKDGYTYYSQEQSNDTRIQRILTSDIENFPGIKDNSETNRLYYMLSNSSGAIKSSFQIEKGDGSTETITLNNTNTFFVSENEVLYINSEDEFEEKVLVKNTIANGVSYKQRNDGNFYLSA